MSTSVEKISIRLSFFRFCSNKKTSTSMVSFESMLFLNIQSYNAWGNPKFNSLYLYEGTVVLCTLNRAMVPKAAQSSQALEAKILLTHNLHLIKKGAFQKSANFSRPTNHAQVIEPIGSLCMIVGLAPRVYSREQTPIFETWMFFWHF